MLPQARRTLGSLVVEVGDEFESAKARSRGSALVDPVALSRCHRAPSAFCRSTVAAGAAVEFAKWCSPRMPVPAMATAWARLRMSSLEKRLRS